MVLLCDQIIDLSHDHHHRDDQADPNLQPSVSPVPRPGPGHHDVMHAPYPPPCTALSRDLALAVTVALITLWVDRHDMRVTGPNPSISLSPDRMSLGWSCSGWVRVGGRQDIHAADASLFLLEVLPCG